MYKNTKLYIKMYSLPIGILGSEDSKEDKAVCILFCWEKTGPAWQRSIYKVC